MIMVKLVQAYNALKTAKRLMIASSQLKNKLNHDETIIGLQCFKNSKRLMIASSQLKTN